MKNSRKKKFYLDKLHFKMNLWAREVAQQLRTDHALLEKCSLVPNTHGSSQPPAYFSSRGIQFILQASKGTKTHMHTHIYKYT